MAVALIAGGTFATLIERRYSRTQPSGGVVERFMAPVLKTGRLKGLVGSNPTPSVLIFDWRLAIGDFRQHDSPNQTRAKNSDHRGAHDVGQVMRAEVKPREAD
jgi:hypothetical protein